MPNTVFSTLHWIITALPPPNAQSQSLLLEWKQHSWPSCFLAWGGSRGYMLPSSLKLNETLVLPIGASISTPGTRIFQSVETGIIRTKSTSLDMMVNGTTATSTPWFWIHVRYLMWAQHHIMGTDLHYMLNPGGREHSCGVSHSSWHLNCIFKSPSHCSIRPAVSEWPISNWTSRSYDHVTTATLLCCKVGSLVQYDVI